MERVQCHQCRGAGRVNYCPRCSGQGKVKAQTDGEAILNAIAGIFGGQSEWQLCGGCDGQGSDVCTRCNGTGYCNLGG
jgi:hypothetical protein